MKLSKIISVFAAVAMLSASFVTVNAAEEITTATNEDFGMQVITSLPTREDAKLRTPSVSFTVAEEPISSKANLLKAANATFAANWGKADFYLVTATFSNVGIFANGYDNDLNRLYVGVGDFIVTLDSKDVLFSGAKEAQLTGGKVSAGIKKDTTVTTVNFHADASNPYPYYDADALGDAVVDTTNAPISINFVVGVETGSYAVIPASAMSASVGYATSGSKLDYIDLAVSDLVVGKAPIVDDGTLKIEISDPMAITAGDVNGIAWDVAFKNFDSTLTYTAHFSSNGVERNPEGQWIEFDIETDADFGFAAILNKVQLGAEDTVDFEIKY